MSAISTGRNGLVINHKSFVNHCQNVKNKIKQLLTFHPKEWIGAFRPNSKYPFFVRGDIDGFVALFIGNLSTLLAVILSLQPILGDNIVYGKILPGTGLAMLWEKRGDVCVMPYGICTPGAFAFIYVIISPTYYGCISTHDKAYCQQLAWYVALASNLITGIVLLLLCIFGEFIRKNTPSIALLTSISGLGYAILALNEYLPVAETPIVAFIPFTIVMLGYFGGVTYGPVPIAVVALAAGTVLGWATSLNQGSLVKEAAHLVKFYAPVFPIKEMIQHMDTIRFYLSTTIPTAIVIAIGTIQCVETAKRAGDFYPTHEAMFVDGIGTLIATCFGSILSMTAYIGHPATKKMGAKQAYSLMNGLSYLPLCFFGISGLLISIIAIIAINPVVIFIGLVICSDTLAITPQRHYPAFLFGIMPIVADWARGTIISGASNAYSNFTLPNAQFSSNVSSVITGFSYRGLTNFAGGSLLQSVFITAILMYMIDRKFLRATVWSLIADFFSFFGLINASNVGVLVKNKDDGWRFSVAYTMLAVFFLLLEIAQRKHWIKGQKKKADDLSSFEMN
ncbi:unnamed protein product [Rotaria sp. Silwood1]|nr:unnamed protein product [Rotaria sp. Silwood1]